MILSLDAVQSKAVQRVEIPRNIIFSLSLVEIKQLTYDGFRDLCYSWNNKNGKDDTKRI